MIEIYADVVFLINFLMDLFIFKVVAVIAGKKPLKRRLFAAAFASSLLYCLLIFAPYIRDYYNFFSSLIVLLTGIVIAFGVEDIIEFFKLIVLSHISAFAIGGGAMALFYYTNITDIIGNMIGFSINYMSAKVLLTSVCISYIVIKIGQKIVQRMAIKKQAIYSTKVFFLNEEIAFNALVDTGNDLYDPVTKEPVIIAELELLRKLLPKALQEIFDEKCENDLAKLIEGVSGTTMEKHLRMIPFKSLGKENGMLIGFKPDAVQIDKDGKSILIDSVVIGIYNLSLSKTGKYQGLIGPDVLSKGAEA